MSTVTIPNVKQVKTIDIKALQRLVQQLQNALKQIEEILQDHEERLGDLE